MHIVCKLRCRTPGPSHLCHRDRLYTGFYYPFTEGVRYRTSIWVVEARLTKCPWVISVRLVRIKVGKRGDCVWVMCATNGRCCDRLGVSATGAWCPCQVEIGIILCTKPSASGGIRGQRVHVAAAATVTVELWPFDGFVVVEVCEPLSSEFPDEKAEYGNDCHTACYRQPDDSTSTDAAI